jgi:3-phenylpropionate/trans-cinnamate dioxygenase ferredoxin component
MADDFVRVAKLVEIPDGEVRVFDVVGVRLALCNAGGQIFAIDDTCTHDDGPLGSGLLDGHAIECPRHGARFDVRTGAVLRMPAAFPVRTYKTRIQNGDVQVDLGDDTV